MMEPGESNDGTRWKQWLNQVKAMIAPGESNDVWNQVKAMMEKG